MVDTPRSKANVELSPSTEGSNDLRRSKPLKIERTRRSWSVREDEILLVTLKDLVAMGWKSDNGFRAGYLTRVEEALRREFPATDLKVNPHIIWKITTWKKSYYSLVGILSRSGVGFNLNGDHKIDCNDDQWAQVVKIDGNAKYMCNKPWPYWEDWKEIFGKDRANGSGTEDILDAVNQLDSQENNANPDMGSKLNVSLDYFFAYEQVPESASAEAVGDSWCQTEKDIQNGKKGNRKRKGVDGMEGVVHLLSKMHEDTNARLQELSTRIRYDFDLSKARKEVYELVCSITGSSMTEKFDVCEVLVKEPERLDLFKGLPEAERHAYVFHVLEKERRK